MSDVLDRPLHGVAIYNPRLLSKEELIGFFVARHVELERLTEALRREAKAQPQHHLVVGARGMGKTTLLNRLRYVIDDDDELASRCFGLVFPEEQYNVVCLADFWLNCVDALADGLESAGRLELLEGLDEEIARIQVLPQRDDRGHQALELLCRLSDRLARRLVLLVDNVDLVLDRIDDEQWGLREVLSSESRIQLIGATSAPLESHYRHDKAFYDFFRVHHLEGLDDEETLTVLRRMAEETGQDRVIRLIDEEPGRVKAVRLMAGGNPRTVVMLFSVLAQGTEGDVRTDIERLLDQCTPLYKHRLEMLPMQAQQVLDGLAKHWAPATAAEVAAATHLPVNAVSSQLDRLVKDGTVEKVSLPDTKRQGFQIAERFFNIWCLMRASRRVRRRLVWLVEFLRLMFGAEDLTARARRHLKQPPLGVRGAELGLAFADLMEDESLRTALETHSLRALSHEPELRQCLAELLDLEGHDRHLVGRAERLQLLAEAREAIMSASIDDPDWDPERYWELLGGLPWMSVRLKHDVTTGYRSFPAHTLEAGMRRAWQRVQEAFVPSEIDCLASAIRNGEIDIDDPIRGELEAAALVHEEPSLAACVLGYASHRGIRIDFDWLDAEIRNCRSLLPWQQWALRAHDGGASVEEVLASFVPIAEGYTWGSFGLALLGDLFYDLGRYDDAESEYRRALLTSNGDPWGTASLGLARVLYSKGGDLTEASDAAMTSVRAGGMVTMDSLRGIIMHTTILIASGDWARAKRQLGFCISWLPGVATDGYWSELLLLFNEIMRHGIVGEARALLSSSKEAERWEPLDHALGVLEHGDTSPLERLAPEMREAVRLVLSRLSPQAPEESAPPPPKRRRATTRKS